MDVNGLNVLITGASRGIGADMAREFAGAGASVILSARTGSAISDLATELGGAAVPFDAADPAQVSGFIGRVEAEHGPVDVLVNNAGVEILELAEDTSEDDIERTIRVNLITPEQLTVQALPGMLQRGRGHLVYTSSVAATAGLPAGSVYSSTKGGLTRFAESVRMEMRYTPVGVTILHLGPVDTSMWDRMDGDPRGKRGLERGAKLGLLAIASSEEVAKATLVAVEKGRREVRLPKRMAAGMAVNGAGTRTYEAALRGIDVRADFGKPSLAGGDGEASSKG